MWEWQDSPRHQHLSGEDGISSKVLYTASALLDHLNWGRCIKPPTKSGIFACHNQNLFQTGEIISSKMPLGTLKTMQKWPRTTLPDPPLLQCSLGITSPTTHTPQMRPKQSHLSNTKMLSVWSWPQCGDGSSSWCGEHMSHNVSHIECFHAWHHPTSLSFDNHVCFSFTSQKKFMHWRNSKSLWVLWFIKAQNLVTIFIDWLIDTTCRDEYFLAKYLINILILRSIISKYICEEYERNIDSNFWNPSFSLMN